GLNSCQLRGVRPTSGSKRNVASWRMSFSRLRFSLPRTMWAPTPGWPGAPDEGDVSGSGFGQPVSSEAADTAATNHPPCTLMVHLWGRFAPHPQPLSPEGRGKKESVGAYQGEFGPALPTPDVLLEFGAELLDGVLHRPAGAVGQAADRRARHDADGVA